MQANREAEVWERVLAASAACPATAPAPAKDPSAEQVQTLMLRQRQQAAVYSALAGRVRRSLRPYLLQLAADARKQARQLEAIYYLLTGRRPCPEPVKAPCIACTNEELRRAYEQELADDAQYQALAARSERFADPFRTMHCTCQRHSAMLLELLQHCL